MDETKIIKAFGYKDGVFIQRLIKEYKHKKKDIKSNGWVLIPRQKILQDTRLSIYVQKKISDRLERMGILRIKREGIPPTNQYNLNMKKINEIIKRKVNNEKSHV